MRLGKIFAFFHRLLTDHELSKSRKKRKGGGKKRGMIKGLPKSSHYVANYFSKTGYSK